MYYVFGALLRKRNLYLLGTKVIAGFMHKAYKDRCEGVRRFYPQPCVYPQFSTSA